MIRLRSACARRMLSKSGISRTGTSSSPSGRGALGRSKSSLPDSSRNVFSRGRRRSNTGRIARPDQARMSAGDAGPNAPR